MGCMHRHTFAADPGVEIFVALLLTEDAFFRGVALTVGGVKYEGSSLIFLVLFAVTELFELATGVEDFDGFVLGVLPTDGDGLDTVNTTPSVLML